MVDEFFATFSGYKIAPGHPAVPGPFIVRVYEDREKKPKYFRAEMLPTHQKFRGDRFDKCRDVRVLRDNIANLFEKQLTDWSETKP